MGLGMWIPGDSDWDRAIIAAMNGKRANLKPLQTRMCAICEKGFTTGMTSSIVLCSLCINNHYKFDIQNRLGALASHGRIFTVRIRDAGLFQPVYDWCPEKLDVRDYIGHMVMVGTRGDMPTLLISKVKSISYDDEESRAISWPTRIVSTPLMHSNDRRTIRDLAVDEFHLSINLVYCTFKRKLKTVTRKT